MFVALDNELLDRGYVLFKLIEYDLLPFWRYSKNEIYEYKQIISCCAEIKLRDYKSVYIYMEIFFVPRAASYSVSSWYVQLFISQIINISFS